MNIFKITKYYKHNSIIFKRHVGGFAALLNGIARSHIECNILGALKRPWTAHQSDLSFVVQVLG